MYLCISILFSNCLCMTSHILFGCQYFASYIILGVNSTCRTTFLTRFTFLRHSKSIRERVSLWDTTVFLQHVKTRYFVRSLSRWGLRALCTYHLTYHLTIISILIEVLGIRTHLFYNSRYHVNLDRGMVCRVHVKSSYSSRKTSIHVN